MDWSTVVPTVVGGVLALGGGLLGQWWANRRAYEREQRDHAHEHAIWSRSQRREAYVSFYALAWTGLTQASVARGQDEVLHEPSREDLDLALSGVVLMGTREAEDAAFEVVTRLLKYRNGTGASFKDTNHALQRYRDQVRVDLGFTG